MRKMTGILINMVSLLSLTACTGQDPSADILENNGDAALGDTSVSSVESEGGDISDWQEELVKGSFAEEGVPSEEAVSSGSYPYDSVFP